MKLATFKTAKGASYGAVMDKGIVDLGKRLGNRYPDLKALIAGNGFRRSSEASEGAAGPQGIGNHLAAGHPQPRQDRLRRPELPGPRGRDRPRQHRAAGDLPARRRVAGRPPAADRRGRASRRTSTSRPRSR